MYETLANYYDALIDEDYYRKWTDYVESFVKDRKSGCDVGCGSGIFTVMLMQNGHDVMGIDASPQMLDKAFARAVSLGVKPRFACMRAEKLTLGKKVGFITAVNDVVNYMKNPILFFKAARANLEEGGLLLFDVSSPYKYERVLAGNTFSLESNDTVCVWKNSPLSKGSVQMQLKFFTKEKSGLYSLTEETQTQYVHDADCLKKMLVGCGFEKIEVYGDLTRRRPKGNTLRIHFAATV